MSRGEMFVWVAERTNASDVARPKSPLGVGGGQVGAVLKGLSPEILHKSLEDFCQGVGQILIGTRQVGEFELEEVTLQVEVSAEGGFELIGVSKAGGAASMQLKFKRKLY